MPVVPLETFVKEAVDAAVEKHVRPLSLKASSLSHYLFDLILKVSKVEKTVSAIQIQNSQILVIVKKIQDQLAKVRNLCQLMSVLLNPFGAATLWLIWSGVGVISPPLPLPHYIFLRLSRFMVN